MRAGKNKIRRLRAQLIMEWMAEFGFDVVNWKTVMSDGYGYITSETKTWDKVSQLETAKVLDSINGNYQLNRERAVRYMEKYL